MNKLLWITLSIGLSFQLLSATSVQPLNSGKAVNDSVKQKEKKYYNITVPKNKSIRVNLTGLEADVDLYIKKGDEVRLRYNDCFSSNSNTENEECIVTNEGESSIYSILVNGFKASSFNLKATIEAAEEIPTLTSEPITDAVEQKEGKQYRLEGKKSKVITVTLSDLTGNADLRVRVGRKAGLHSFNCKSINRGTKTEECVIRPKKDATVYVHVYGRNAASYSLKATQKKSFLFPLEMALEKGNKAYENNKNCESDEIVCADKGNRLIYVLESEQNMNGDSSLVKSKLYKIRNKNFINKMPIDYIDETRVPSSLIKIKNSDLIGIKIHEHHHPSNYNIDIYSPSGKRILSKSFIYTQTALETIKTIENGSKLVIKYIKSEYGDMDVTDRRFLDTYDISNTSNVKLISHVEQP